MRLVFSFIFLLFLYFAFFFFRCLLFFPSRPFWRILGSNKKVKFVVIRLKIPSRRTTAGYRTDDNAFPLCAMLFRFLSFEECQKARPESYLERQKQKKAIAWHSWKQTAESIRTGFSSVPSSDIRDCKRYISGLSRPNIFTVFFQILGTFCFILF